MRWCHQRAAGAGSGGRDKPGSEQQPGAGLSTGFLPAIYCNAAANSVPVRYYVTAINSMTGQIWGRHPWTLES